MTDPKPLSPVLASLALLLAATPSWAEAELGPFTLRGFIGPEETSLPAELPPAQPVMAQSQPILGQRGVSRFVFPVMDPPSIQTASIPARPTLAQRGAPRLALIPRDSMTDASILVHEAIGRSDKLRSAQHEVYAAKARVWKAWSGYVPVVTGTIWAGRDPNAAPDLTDPGKTATISASMPLFDGGQIINSSRAAQRNASAAAAEKRGLRDQVALDTLNAVIELDVARRQRVALQRSVDALMVLRAAVVTRIAAGFASQADLAEVDADIAEARNTLVSSEAAQARATTQLSSLVGHPVATHYRLPDFSKMMAEGIEPLRAHARAANPSLEASWHRAEAARYASYSAMGRYMPRLDVRVDYKAIRNYRTSNSGEGWTVGLALKVPLVEAGTLADVAEARENATAARYRAMDKGREIDTQIELEWQNYQSTGRQASILEGKVRSLERALEARRAQFASGLAPLEDVLSIGRRVLAARVEAIEASARRQSTAISLAARAGRLTELSQGL